MSELKKTKLSIIVEKKGMKLRYLAKQSGLNYDRLSRLHRGLAIMRLDEAIKLSKVLHVSTSELTE